jgi:hypothetical protein
MDSFGHECASEGGVLKSSRSPLVSFSGGSKSKNAYFARKHGFNFAFSGIGQVPK